ncbi:MAG: FKBP-type peptidyl-prolyl cis-trans isomerase [Phycisphaerales bacterium]|nr:FKBP-type peptidyl-prolyl cis-trans isomerase [Phycisphaerales bacterium]
MTTRIAAVALTASALLLASCANESPNPKAAEVKPEPAPTPPAALPGTATTAASTTVAPGVHIWDITPGTGPAIDGLARDVTMSVSGWTQDGTQYFGSATASDELVLGTANTTAFPGWSEALDGMQIGGTRKIWAAPPKDATSWPVEGYSPIVMEVTLHAINSATVAGTLPGAATAGAAPQGGPNGLRFYDLTTTGTGTTASAGDTISLRYEAWLADGTPIAAALGEPVTFTLNDTLSPGLAAGIEGLAAGAKRKLVIPASIGAGFSPMGDVPAGSTVIIDIDIVDVTPATTTAQVE